MRITLFARVATLVVAFLLAGCSTVQGPTPTVVRPTLAPSKTPNLQVVVTRGTPERTVPPTWTPLPTFTPVPTLTRGPTGTLPSTTTSIPSATPVGGKPGILTTEGLLALEVSTKDLNDALATARDSPYFAASINFPPTATLAENGLTLNVNFNDGSRAGQIVDFNIILAANGTDVVVNVTNYRIKDSTAQLSAAQVQLIRDLLRGAVNLALQPKIKPLAPEMRSYLALSIAVSTEQILVTLKVIQATLSPGELTATAMVSITPTKGEATEPGATATQPPKPTDTPKPTLTSTSTQTQSPLPTNTARPTATQTPQPASTDAR